MWLSQPRVLGCSTTPAARHRWWQCHAGSRPERSKPNAPLLRPQRTRPNKHQPATQTKTDHAARIAVNKRLTSTFCCLVASLHACIHLNTQAASRPAPSWILWGSRQMRSTSSTPALQSIALPLHGGHQASQSVQPCWQDPRCVHEC